MTATDAQVRILMKEIRNGKAIGKAALQADMDRKTARKYNLKNKLPSELKKERNWKTKTNPFESDWEVITSLLEENPTLQSKIIFEYLQREHPGRYTENQLRTLQRHIRRWRAQLGAEKEVFFRQEHVPGERAQTDFTWGNDLAITIGGEEFQHMLCHVVLPYSLWSFATVCRSESMAALRRGIQAAFFSIGRAPRFHQTDNSTAATHQLKKKPDDDEERKMSTATRPFNDEYVALMNHLGMEPCTTGVGKKEQNGSVESRNGALKKTLEQHLMLRGSRNFESVSAYEKWVQDIMAEVNHRRKNRFYEEKKAMRVLKVKPLPEFSELKTKVRSWSTIQVRNNTYSVPSRLIGEEIKVHVYDDRIEVFYAGKRELKCRRLLGKKGHFINYRHVIHSLLKKPGAFRLYKFRSDLFPSTTFRKAFDNLSSRMTTRKAELEYMKILQLAASNMECDVEEALLILLDDEKSDFDSDYVRAWVCAEPPPEMPKMEELKVDLTGYDSLLSSDGGAS